MTLGTWDGLRPDLAEPLVGLLLLLQRHEHPQLVEQSLATPHSGASARPRPRGIRAVTRERVPRAARAGVGAVSVAIPACAIILAVAAVMVAQAVEGTGVSTAVNLAGAELSVVEGAPPTRRRARLGVLAPATQLIGDALAARLVALARPDNVRLGRGAGAELEVLAKLSDRPVAVPSVQWAVSTFTIVSSSSLKCLPEHQPHGGSDVQLAQSGCASQASSALTAA
eukprot:CAMPEP_0202787934 /NCGR_PEP_ID=MMETSP1388-20130828/73566_1 /ASSEMBLY_ACC=CAM_ASM_000864 /TAXON_ID=37098 /ORGANISM="Isochrysis sp, Strain CCMP1244" /LENGTH=225 /DNA_ID=CAMNT_0049457555 /DNA_START=95 /DNA_END=770 /DNA_ORIENTATION=+